MEVLDLKLLMEFKRGRVNFKPLKNKHSERILKFLNLGRTVVRDFEGSDGFCGREDLGECDSCQNLSSKSIQTCSNNGLVWFYMTKY